ncbi:MAG: A/G-specific adenine glycosylase [Salibacteraceae bacterium]|nr:A/G-specific adenine glycosylase [Salibacteraceae bacterium]
MRSNFFTESLLNWFENNERNLPWRQTKDPYIIWLSEVILQQTRVAQGLPYFLKFAKRFPTVNDFAIAEEDEILKLWQGLGYYSRARNMLKTSQLVAEKGAGFPSTYHELIQLKGIGEYTASAIASFSANEKVAVVDGNVYRVLSRYFGVHDAIDQTIGKKNFKKVAEQLLPAVNSDQYNQAIMEFGALQCKPKRPDCSTCPLSINCIALKEKTIDQLPFKSKKQTKKKINLYYLVFKNDENILIRQRRGLGVWEGLYDFAAIEITEKISHDEILKYSKETFGFTINKIKEPAITYKHILSHIVYQASFWEIEINSSTKVIDNYTWIDQSLIGNYPVSRLVEKYLEG